MSHDIEHPNVAFWCEKCQRQVQNVLHFGHQRDGFGFRLQCHGQFEMLSVPNDANLKAATEGQPLTIQVFKQKAKKRGANEPNVVFYCDRCAEMTDDWLWQKFPREAWELDKKTGREIFLDLSEHHFMVRCHGRLCGGQKQLPAIFKAKDLIALGCWKSATPILLPIKARLLGKVAARDFSEAQQKLSTEKKLVRMLRLE